MAPSRASDAAMFAATVDLPTPPLPEPTAMTLRTPGNGIWAGPQSLLKVEFKDTDQRLTDSVNHGANLLECIRTRKKPVSDVEEGHIASCLGMVADIAGRTEARLAWDPKTERFLNNDEANALLSRELHNGWTL